MLGPPRPADFPAPPEALARPNMRFALSNARHVRYRANALVAPAAAPAPPALAVAPDALTFSGIFFDVCHLQPALLSCLNHREVLRLRRSSTTVRVTADWDEYRDRYAYVRRRIVDCARRGFAARSYYYSTIRAFEPNVLRAPVGDVEYHYYSDSDSSAGVAICRLAPFDSGRIRHLSLRRVLPRA